MTFLANENFPGPSIRYLRERGFDVMSVSEEFSGSSDVEIVDIARASGLTILTQDKGYGTLVFKNLVDQPPPIILFRFPKEADQDAAGKALEFMLSQGTGIEGKFTVIDEVEWRQKTYESLEFFPRSTPRRNPL